MKHPNVSKQRGKLIVASNRGIVILSAMFQHMSTKRRVNILTDWVEQLQKELNAANDMLMVESQGEQTPPNR